MKKHNTFPGEQPEMPLPNKATEVTQPADPKGPNTPQEDPDQIPDELPPVDNPPEDPPLNPGSIA